VDNNFGDFAVPSCVTERQKVTVTLIDVPKGCKRA